ncbi:CinA family protein [Cryobacterium sp. SO2]|uniref:CinA family protein n=1 Tax=Cryobacterium sp. SO2 TaxID=1897060 RepID=UPI00223CD55A|nr:CinA family protein [Cryobacterium sp. SO2]WEO78638.1 CinA family protein [Cryobacterium sp. SO2]
MPAESARATDAAADLVATLTARHLTIAVAESLTGGLLVAELVRIPGASAVLAGGVVAYQTPLKHTLLGVDAVVLAEHGAVHPEVARQMASGVRTALAVDGRPADIGIATTGVAGPDEQDGQAVGTVYLGVSFGDSVRAMGFSFTGGRAEIRAQAVEQAIEAVRQLMEPGKPEFAE